MTREERLELLKQIEKDIHVCSLESTFLEDAKSCAIHSAIEELEQEPIIDKVKQAREEIEHLSKYGKETYYRAIDDVLEILDKLIAESEG